MTTLKRHLVAAYIGTCLGVSTGLALIHAATGGVS